MDGPPEKSDRGGDEPLVCPGCQQPLTAASAVLCHACHAPQHSSCWQVRARCVVAGCGSRLYAAAPADSPGVVEFRYRPPLVMDQILPGYLALSMGFYLAVLLFVLHGDASAHLGALALLFATYVLGFLGICLGPDAYEERYRIDRNGSQVTRTRHLGPLRLPGAAAWTPRHQVAELLVRPVHRMLPDGGDEIRRLEVLLEDQQGRHHLLETLPWRARNHVLARVKAAAQLLDTVVHLPAELAYPRGLPPGVTAAVHRLPARGPSEEEA